MRLLKSPKACGYILRFFFVFQFLIIGLLSWLEVKLHILTTVPANHNIGGRRNDYDIGAQARDMDLLKRDIHYLMYSRVEVGFSW